MSPADSTRSGSTECRVGIFWLYQNRPMASAVPLERADTRGTKGDSPEAHVAMWPRIVARHKAELPILSRLEYEEVPRGRRIFDTATPTVLVYMDETLFADTQPAREASAPVWEALRAAFRLDGQRVRFSSDLHYRVDPCDDQERGD
ncbi:hypothetical protein [Thiocystis violacea]|uniref:hypothetical protein n=1 Tax=Thiocystis violacea TaxID=13725 RepID=UPI0019042DC7|nr:hypothetical protein [Thiocystis violacea]